MNFIDPLIGGAILGLSSILLLIACGRIAGISGIVGSLLTQISGNGWRWMFVIGLVLGPLLVAPSGYLLPQVDASWWMMIVGGLLVGFGSSIGSGCTSGHGICGIGRLSMRSISSVIVFMVVAALSVFVIRHILGAA